MEARPDRSFCKVVLELEAPPGSRRAGFISHEAEKSVPVIET